MIRTWVSALMVATTIPRLPTNAACLCRVRGRSTITSSTWAAPPTVSCTVRAAHKAARGSALIMTGVQSGLEQSSGEYVGEADDEEEEEDGEDNEDVTPSIEEEGVIPSTGWCALPMTETRTGGAVAAAAAAGVVAVVVVVVVVVVPVAVPVVVSDKKEAANFCKAAMFCPRRPMTAPTLTVGMYMVTVTVLAGDDDDDDGRRNRADCLAAMDCNNAMIVVSSSGRIVVVLVVAVDGCGLATVFVLLLLLLLLLLL